MAAENTLYTETDRGQEKQYPGYVDAKPNLQSFLDAINKSNPIVQSQYEMVWSRWPRTLFFAKNIDIPGIKTQTQEINHAGFTISIPTHPKYDSTEINFTIVADKEGYHYYDIRNMVLQTGHPLVAGDTRATIGSSWGLGTSEDSIDVRLRNMPEDAAYHHWIIHNFHPTAVGNISLSQDGGSFVEFEVTGTFTHITYLSGDEPQSQGTLESQPSLDDGEKSDFEKDMEEQEQQREAEQAQQQQDESSSEESSPEDEEKEEEEQETDWEAIQKAEDDKCREEIEKKAEEIKNEKQEEELPPPFVNCITAKDIVCTNEDGMMSASVVANVEVQEPATEQQIELANQCTSELQQAQEEFNAEMQRISKMPKDPNYPPTKFLSDDCNYVYTPQDGQSEPANPEDEGNYVGDQATACIQVMATTVTSAEQKAAIEQAMSKYNERAKTTLNNYKEAKRQMEVG